MAEAKVDASRPLRVVERPICNCDLVREHERRCRRLATGSWDGIWLCPECQEHSPVVTIVIGRPIVRI